MFENWKRRRFGIIVAAAFAATLIWLVQSFAGLDFPAISTSDLINFIDGKEKITLIDARTPQEYAEAHITGAINIPEKDFDRAAKRLPADKRSVLVFYCNGTKCGKSNRVAKLVAPLGYSNILIYSEGIPVWEEKGLPLMTGPGYGKKIETKRLKPAELSNLIKQGKGGFVLVDVRDQAEFREGHIPSAVNIPAETFAMNSDVLPKDKKIIVYCNTGSRSYLAYRKLVGLAYPDINQALFAEWKEGGLPVEKE
jgi:rhodanese-related sulfurtransferase